MKNTLTRLIDVIPSIINYGVDFDDTNIPKHWGFSPNHMKDIKGIIYHLDKNGNVYQQEDVIANKMNPKIIAKYVKNGEHYSIPEFNI